MRSLAIFACLAAALPAWSQAPQAPTRPQIAGLLGDAARDQADSLKGINHA